MKINNTWVYTHLTALNKAFTEKTDGDMLFAISVYSNEALSDLIPERIPKSILENSAENPVFSSSVISTDREISGVCIRFWVEDDFVFSDVFESVKKALVLIILAYTKINSEYEKDATVGTDEYFIDLADRIPKFLESMKNPKSDKYVDENSHVYRLVKESLDKQTFEYYSKNIDEEDLTLSTALNPTGHEFES